MPQLSSEQRRELRAQAHSLNPVVSISENGLSESVLKEIDTCLNAHELIKIRVYGDNREDRDDYMQQICADLEASPVQQIGKLLVIYRAAPKDESGKPGSTRRNPPRKTKRSFQG